VISVEDRELSGCPLKAKWMKMWIEWRNFSSKPVSNVVGVPFGSVQRILKDKQPEKLEFGGVTGWNFRNWFFCVTMTTSMKVRQTQLQYYILWGWLHVSASTRPSSGYPLVNKSIKSKPYEMPAHCGIPCGFTTIVMDKNK
jgi:hypothetical protein